MKRFLLLFMLLLLVVACGPAVEQEVAESVVETAVVADTPIATAEETATSEPAPEPTDEPVAAEETDAPDTQIAATDFSPATTAAQAAELRSQDWSIGAEEPRIAIIEYGDFQ